VGWPLNDAPGLCRSEAGWRAHGPCSWEENPPRNFVVLYHDNNHVLVLAFFCITNVESFLQFVSKKRSWSSSRNMVSSNWLKRICFCAQSFNQIPSSSSKIHEDRLIRSL
jgi:hypothetical protein